MAITGGGVSGSPSDLVTVEQGIARNLGLIAQTLSSVFPRVYGAFTLIAGQTTTPIAVPSIRASSRPQWEATNATAALTVRTQGLYLSAVTAGVGFAVSTQTSVAIGTETFNYVVWSGV